MRDDQSMQGISGGGRVALLRAGAWAAGAHRASLARIGASRRASGARIGRMHRRIRRRIATRARREAADWHENQGWLWLAAWAGLLLMLALLVRFAIEAGLQ